ncbi:Ubiquitin-like protein 7 [Camelus dromedarius]|uniref:Ubiquitin-like protein 7 n=1 Tax=Camelus dromedarius TaxID=9838 RepID=A0A5N4CEE2_CAMDR|nr:Ubiquitin-like protein 7 [Camelus dromedarius]
MTGEERKGEKGENLAKVKILVVLRAERRWGSELPTDIYPLEILPDFYANPFMRFGSAGGFLFEGLSDDEDDFHPSARSTPSSSTPSSRPASLGYSGAAGPRPITQSELATALALASTPESSSHTPTPGTQGHSSGTSPMSSSVQSGTPITNDLFSQALQHALQASGQPSLQEELGRGSVTGEAAPSKASGGFLFEGLSDDEDDFHPSARSTPSSSTPSSRPASLGYSGAAGPRPITQSELATALALASTPESSSHTPTPGTQGHSSGTSPMSSSVQSGTPITNDLFSQALQHALQASGQPSLQVSLPHSWCPRGFLVTFDPELFSALRRAFPLGLLCSRRSWDVAV